MDNKLMKSQALQKANHNEMLDANVIKINS